LKQIPITLASGRRVVFEVGEDGPQPPCFLLGMRKCGSTIINHICAALAEANGRTFVNVGHTFFALNILADEWSIDPSLSQIVRPGSIYGGFRTLPESLVGDPAFVSAPKLLLIRDPRDALVSEYFSNAYSHPIPAAADGANAVAQLLEKERAKALAESIQATVVRRARPMGRDFKAYAKILAMPGLLVLKYEDMILRKAEMIAHLATHFQMQASDALVADILAWADVRPAEDDPHRFIRQVSPGDHRRKLDAATIAQLNRALEEPMKLFGYEP
jgi:hypothetical protein